MTAKFDYIIDAHAHLGYSKDFYYPNVSVESILHTMDKLNIDKILQTHTLLFCGEYSEGVNRSIEAFEKSHGKILSYLVFNPRESEKSLKVIKDNINEKLFVGVKIHPSLVDTQLLRKRHSTPDAR